MRRFLSVAALVLLWVCGVSIVAARGPVSAFSRSRRVSRTLHYRTLHRASYLA